MLSMGKSWNRGGKRGFNKNHNYTNNQRGNRNNRGGGRNNRQNRNPRNDHHGNKQYGGVSPSYEGLDPQEYDYNGEERRYDDNFSDFEEGNDGDNFHDGSGMEYDERNVPIDRPPYGYDRGRQMDERRLAPDSEFRHEMEDRRQWRERGEMGGRQWRDRHEMEDRPQRDRRQMDNRHLGDRGQMEHRHLRDRNETEDHHWREQDEMGDRQFRDRHEMEDRPWRDRGQMEHRHWEGRNEIEERQWGEQDEMVNREWIDNQEQGFDNRGQRQNRWENRYHGHGNRPDNSEFQNRSQSRDRDGYDERRRSWHREEEGIDREHFDGGPFEPNHGERYKRDFLEEENRVDYRNWPDDRNQAYQQKDGRGSQQRDSRGNQQRDQRESQQRDQREIQQRDQRESQQRDQRGSQQRQSHSSSSSRNGQNKSNNRSRTRSRTRTRSSASKSQMNNGSQSCRNKERRQRGSRGKKKSNKQADKSGQQSKNLNVLPPGLAMHPSQGLVPGPDLSNLLPGDKPGEVLVLIDPDTGIAMPLTTDNAAMINTIPPGPALNNPPLHIPPAFGVKQPTNRVDGMQRSGYDRVRDKYRGGANQRENNAKNSGFFKNRVVSNLRTKATSFKIQPSKTGGNLTARGRININDKRNLNNKTKQIEKNLKPEVKKPSSAREAKILEEPLTMLPINRDTEDLFKSLIQKRRQELKETKQNEIVENALYLDDSRHVSIEDDMHSSREEDHFQYHDRSVELHGKNNFYESEQYPHQNSSWDIERPEDIRNQQQDHRRYRNDSDYQKSRPDVRDRLDNNPRYDPSGPPRSDGFGRPDHGHVNTHHEQFNKRMPAKERLGFQHGQHEGENASNSDFRKNLNFNDGVDRTVTYEHDNSKSEIYQRDTRYGNDRVGNSMSYNSHTDSRSTSGIGESRGTEKQNESPVGNSWNRANKSQNDYYDQNRKNVNDGFNRNKESNDRSFSKDDSFVSNRTSYPKETRKTRWAPADETVNQERKVELYDIKNTQTALKRNSSNISSTPPEHKSDTRDSRYRHSSSLSPKRRKYDNDTHDLQNKNQGQEHEKARDTRGKNGDHLQGQERTVKVTPEKSVNQPQKRGNSLDRDHKIMEKMSPSRRQEQDRDKREHEKISDMDRVNRTLAHASQLSHVGKTDKVSPGRTNHGTPSGPSSSGDRKSSGSGQKSDSKPTPPDVLSFQKNQIKTLSSILEVLQNKINADENRKKKEEKRKAEEMKLKNSALETAKRMHEKASKIIKEPIPGESTMQTVVKDLDPTVVPLLDKMKPRMSKTGAPIPSLLDGMDHLSKLSVEEKVKLAATLPRLAEVADPNKMSLADKIRLLRFIMDTKNQDENPIQIVEESIRGCGLGLTLKYEAHEIKCVAGRPAFTGTLYLSDAFLGRCVGFTKKEIKHNIYEQALNLLKNKTAAEIVAMKDPGIDELRKELVLSIVEDKHKKSELSETESQESKFKKLKQYIQDCKKTHLTPAVFLQKAIELSECHLRSHFYTKRVNLPIGELFFFHKGVLLIDDIVVGLATGHKGKNVKPATYCNAIEAFQTKSVKDILKGIRPLEADVLPPIFVDREKFKISSKKRMEYLVKYLKESQIEDHQEAINKGAKECWLTPLCVYKKPKKQKKWFHCEFFINHLLVGEGEGKEMKDAELEAYNSAWRQLRNVNVETMFENNRKMELADFSDPLIVDVQLKVNFQSVSNTTDCNLAALKRLKFDLSQEGKTKEGLVILEHEEWSVDRKGQAFSILNHSATQNGMFLHWLIQPEGKLFKCAFNLQGECVGEATAPDRNGAKNLAAADALFRLYDSHDVVKITRWDDSKLWTEYWEIKAQALKLAQDESDGKGVGEKGAPKLKWIIDVCQQMIEDYMKKYSLEELIFGPGMPLMERSEVQKLAKKMELKHEMRQQEGNAYLVLSKKMTPQEMATCLHQNGGISGKYSLVPVTQLPKSSSIEQEKRKYKRPGYDKLLEEVEDTKKPRLASDENTGTPSSGSSINTTRNTFSDSKTVSTQAQGHSNKMPPIQTPILFSSANSTVPASTGPITVSKAAIPPPGVAIPMLSTQPNYQAVPTQQAPIVAVSQLVSQANVQTSSAAYNTPLSYRLPDSVVPQYGAPVSRVYTTLASTAVPVQAVTTQPAISSSFVFGLNQTTGIQQPLIHQTVQNTPVQQVLNSVASVNTPTVNNQGIYVQGLQPVSQGIKPVIPQPVPPVQSTGVKYQSVPPVATSLPLQQTLPQVPTSVSQYRPPAVQQQSIQLNLNAEHQKLLLIQQEALRKMRTQTPQQAGTIMTPQPVQPPHQSVLNRMPPPATMQTQQVANQISTAASVANQTVTPNFSVPPPNFRFPPPAVTSVTYSSMSSNAAGQTQTSSESKTHTAYQFTNKPNLDMLSKPAVTSSIHINLLYKSGQNTTAPSKTQTSSLKTKTSEYQKRRQSVLTTIDTSKHLSTDKPGPRSSSSNVSPSHSMTAGVNSSKSPSSTTTTAAQEESPKSNVQQLVEKALKVFGGTAELESALNTIKGITQEQNKSPGSTGGGILDSILKQRAKETKPAPEKNTATLILSNQPGAKSKIIKPAETKQAENKTSHNKTPGTKTVETKNVDQTAKPNEKYKKSMLGVSGMLSLMRKQQEKEHKSAYEKFKETVVKPSEKEGKSDEEVKDIQTRKQYESQPSGGSGMKGILKQADRIDSLSTDTHFKPYQKQTANQRTYRQTNRDSPPEKETTPRVEVFPRGKGVNELKVDSNQPKVENNQPKPALKSILKNKSASDTIEQRSEDFTEVNKRNNLYYSQFGFNNKQDPSKSNLGQTQGGSAKGYQQSESAKDTPFWMHKSQSSDIDSEYGRHTEPEIYHTKQSSETNTSFMRRKNEHDLGLSGYRSQFGDGTETYDKEDSSFTKSPVIPGLDYVHQKASDQDHEHLYGYGSRPKPLIDASAYGRQSGSQFGSNRMENKPSEERFNAYDLESLLGNKNKPNVNTSQSNMDNYTQNSADQFGQQATLQKLSETLKNIRDNYDHPDDDYYGNTSNMNRNYPSSSDRSSSYNPSFTPQTSRQDGGIGSSSYNPSFSSSLKQQYPFGFGAMNNPPSLQQNQQGYGSSVTPPPRLPGFQGNTMGIPSAIGREYGLPRFSSRQPPPSSSVSSTPSYMMDSLDNFTAESRAERKEKRF